MIILPHQQYKKYRSAPVAENPIEYVDGDMNYYYGGSYNAVADRIDTYNGTTDRFYAAMRQNCKLVQLSVYSLRAVIGFDNDPGSNIAILNQNYISYAITTYYIRESGSTKYTEAATPWVKMLHDGVTITYYADDVLKYTSLSNASAHRFACFGSINDPPTYPLKQPRYQRE